MNIKRFTYLLNIFLLLLMSIAVTLDTQAQKTGDLDKIVAVVGKNRIILKSDIEIQAQQLKAQDPTLTGVECDIMSQVLLQKMLVEQAERDSIVIPEEQIESTLDTRVRYFIMQYGSKEKLEEIAGKTVYQLKEENRETTREMMLAEQMQNSIMETVTVTPVEVKKFYDNIPVDSLPFFPATVEMGQIIIDPEVTPELDSYALNRIRDIRKEIVVDGKDFETQAIFYSQDGGTRDDGGLIRGVTRKGSGLVQEFVVQSFRLQDGEVSPPFKTQFGYHIIQMVKRRGDEADVRHILIKPEVTTADFEKALEKLDSVRQVLVSGDITFNEAVGKYSTDEMSNRTGGMITDQQGNSTIEVEDLDPTLALMIDTLKPGQYSKPMVFTNMRGERSARIVYMKSITTPHKANLQEDYSRIQFAALQKKKGERMQKWIADKAPSYYISVDEEYKSCEAIQPFLPDTAKN